MVEESVEILFHLNGIILGLSHAKYPQFAILPGAVLLQQEGQQHQKATIVHNPPDVNVAADFVAGIRVALNALGHQQRHFSGGRVADGVNEDSPGLALLLPPAVGPTQNHRVGFHATQSSALDTANKGQMFILK